MKGYGRTVPHRFTANGDRLFATRPLASPVANDPAANFAKTLIGHEQLSRDEVLDYLSISFSGVDAMNHFFGPSSLENEQIVLALNRTLTDLIAHADRVTGLERTLIVSSADHGMPEAPGIVAELCYRAKRIVPK